MKGKTIKSIALILLCLVSQVQFAEAQVSVPTEKKTEPKRDLSKVSEEDFVAMENKMKALIPEFKGLKDKVELSVNDVSLEEFIRSLALTNSLNVSVDNSMKFIITNNFSNVTVLEVYMFLARQYNLEISFVGSIMSFSKYVPPAIVVEQVQKKELLVTYKKAGNLVNFDLNEDLLSEVVRKLTKASGKNIAISSDLNSKKVNGYVKDMPFEDALNNLGYSNDLVVEKSENGTYVFAKHIPEVASSTGNRNSKSKNGRSGNKKGKADFVIDVLTNGNINVVAEETPIIDIIMAVCEAAEIKYYLYSNPTSILSLNVKDVAFADLLSSMLKGSEFTFKIDSKGTFLIGERSYEGLRQVKIFEMKFRTAHDIVEFIPKEITKDVTVNVFEEQNSLILSGSHIAINEVENFLYSIDKPVPVILIEVIIVDVSQSKSLSTGISAGLGDKPGTTTGTLLPEYGFDLNANSLNSLISNFNGFGLIKLGSVTPNFYLTLKAMEGQGKLNLRSTPKLATLNSHEATMSIGNTEYYLETTVTSQGSLNVSNMQANRYKAVTADLSIKIKPTVSGNEMVTMEIDVQQSDFTARISPQAPPGKVTRQFTSMIRVKNEEMIVLGGIEESSTSESSSGLPLLSRVPVIKWLFSSRIKEKKKGKMIVFIKPTILY
ncbi:MAG: hypothetical protein HRT71_17185 [Flavobacteriales bacterium]|nr:hypothetical protein [Flavobacteriales bacterium]